jgi:hypothetical protein
MSLEARAKGINFRSFLTVLARVRGEGALERTKALLPEDIRSALDLGAVVASGWYPIAWYRTLHAAMNTACREPSTELSRTIGREASVEEFSGVYRFLLKVITPETLVSQAPRVFRMYFVGGEVRLTESTVGHGVLEFQHWKGFDRCVWADITGGVEGVLVARGASNVRSRVLAGGVADSLTVEYRWT